MANKNKSIICDALCEHLVSGPCAVVIFGASGDLTKRKLLPAFYRLFERGSIPENFYILGYARTELDDNTFREQAKNVLIKTKKSLNTDKCFSFWYT